MAIVVLHRERSEKLMRAFCSTMAELMPDPDFSPEDYERITQAFDALIQDGLISEEQHWPEGRE